MNKNMFFSILLWTSALIAVSLTGAYASTEPANLDATVGVNPVFSITASPSSLDLGSVDPGETTPQKDVVLTCSTNNGTQWSVGINVTAELTCGSYTIPNEDFKWWGWTTGAGAVELGAGHLSATPFFFYEAHSTEYITAAPVEHHLTFCVEVPQGQAAGEYTTTLVFTMTE